MKTNIKQISEITGFSPATISNALNRKKGVNKDTSEEIFRVARELGYVSEDKITKIKFVMYKRSGQIIDDTMFFPIMLDGFEQECRASGYEMVVCYLDRKNEDFEQQLKWILHDSSAAVVLLGTELMEDDIELFRGTKCPFMLLDYWTEGMNFNGVLINNSDSARMAVDYLIARGHRDIGYMRGDFRIKAFRSRFAGYQISLKKHGLQINEKNIITLRTTIDGAHEDMLKYLDRQPKLATAYFADNDMIALGAMKALQERGFHIPDDVSVIGFDDLPFSAISSPGLTSIKVPKQEMGKIAVKKMVEIIKGETQAITKIQVCTEFVERGSVKDIRNRE